MQLVAFVWYNRDMNDYSYIQKNYSGVLSAIENAKSRAGLTHEVTCVAVTKSASDEELLALVSLGVSDIGENRPQELKRRGELLKEAGFLPRLHQIGNLQRNKVRLIIDCAHLIHSLDSIKLAEELDRQAKKAGFTVPVLIEINSGREEQKGGVMPEEAEDFFLSLRGFENLSVAGLMTMGPVSENSEDLRPCFRLTKELFDKINSKYSFAGGGILSMGMSDSFEVAVEEGSTLVRVGRRLFEKEKEK